jgi:K+-transporting ATPase A subunit
MAIRALSRDTFALLLIGTILMLAGLSYFPALSLGPIVEQLMAH